MKSDGFRHGMVKPTRSSYRWSALSTDTAPRRGAGRRHRRRATAPARRHVTPAGPREAADSVDQAFIGLRFPRFLIAAKSTMAMTHMKRKEPSLPIHFSGDFDDDAYAHGSYEP